MADHADTPAQLSHPKDSPTTPGLPDGSVDASLEIPDETKADLVASQACDIADGAPEDSDVAADESDSDSSAAAPPAKRVLSPQRLGVLVGVMTVVVLAGLSGWFGFRAYQLHQTQKQDQLFVQVARQGAVNLTTIDWQHADADVQRILDSATGAFHDDFSTRSQPFVDVVKKVQSKSVGTVVEAGLESTTADEARVLVAVSVKTTMANQPDPQQHSWRMRISVQKLGTDQAKVSEVAFVP